MKKCILSYHQKTHVLFLCIIKNKKRNALWKKTETIFFFVLEIPCHRYRVFFNLKSDIDGMVSNESLKKIRHFPSMRLGRNLNISWSSETRRNFIPSTISGFRSLFLHRRTLIKCTSQKKLFRVMTVERKPSNNVTRKGTGLIKVVFK